MGILKNRSQFNNYDYIALFICLLFYMCFCFIGGVEICADSAGYINMISAREPVYPLFLAFNRLIFGEKIYLTVVIIIQNLLMAFGVFASCEYLVKKFHMKNILIFVFMMMHFAVAFLCQFAAGRSSIYSNSIMTEGICMPLWIILLLLVWDLMDEFTIGKLILVSLLAGVMMDARKQMAVAYIVICGSIFFAYIGKKGFWKKIGLTILFSLLSVVLAICGTRLYNLALRGEFAQNTRDMNLVLTTTLYVADEDDGRLIEEPKVRELFDITYRILDEKKCIMKYAGSDWKSIEQHYEESFDVITVDTTKNLFVDYAVQNGFKEGIEAEMEADRMSSVIVSSLIADNAGSYVKVYLASVLNGLVNSVAKRHRILDIYSFLIYIIYLLLMVICLSRKETRKIGIVALSVLMAVVINVGVIAALIFCQSRYTMYSMALFYVAIILMILGIYKSRKTGAKIEIN